jgi:hypothetical protein
VAEHPVIAVERRPVGTPVARRAAATVRCADARSAPVTGVCTCARTRRENSGANGASSAAIDGGDGDIGTPPDAVVPVVIH